MDLLELNGDKIRSLRESLSWSRDTLSDKSGIPVRTIQDIETGKVVNPGIETLKPLIKAMIPKHYSSEKRSELIITIITLLTSLEEEELNITLNLVRKKLATRTKINTSIK